MEAERGALEQFEVALTFYLGEQRKIKAAQLGESAQQAVDRLTKGDTTASAELKRIASETDQTTNAIYRAQGEISAFVNKIRSRFEELEIDLPQVDILAREYNIIQPDESDQQVAPSLESEEVGSILEQILPPNREDLLERLKTLTVDQLFEEDLAPQSRRDHNQVVRTYNTLKRSQINSVEQILMMSEEELYSLRNFGQVSLRILHEVLNHKLSMPPTEQNPENDRTIFGEP